MEYISLNGKWKIRWSTGQRGGTPFVIKNTDDHDHMNEVLGIKRKLPGSYNGRGWLDATVPGDVHLDLMKHGLLDDPYVGINIFKARWVEECIWHYRRTFDVPDEALQGKAALTFKGLDLTAIVYLNGEEIGRHNNSFCSCVLDVTGKLKPKDNELLVRLESGLFDVCERPIRNAYTATGSMDILLHKRLWLRKPQSHTEWDWSPRLLNVGITDDVYLSFDSSVIIAQASVRQKVSGDLSSAVIEGRLFSVCTADKDARYRMVIEAGGQKEEAVYCEIPDEGFHASVMLKQPNLWYPIGYGPQNLYTVKLTLYVNERLTYKRQMITGLRRVEVMQTEHPVKGHYFIVNINNIPIFIKGANFVPNDIITAAITRERYDKLTDLALEAHFNILRIWGGGLYEADDFYELCDRKGILIWQEFISACGPLPTEDAEFLQNLKKEAVYNIRRLSIHPSLIVWCGNNEIAPYTSPLYMEIYPRLLAEEDPEKYYQPSSPYTSNKLKNVPKDNCNWDYAGDQHPWSVGFLNKDHRDYRRMECRFPNEGGILGPVSLPTLLKCTDGKGDYTNSMNWEIHDNMEHFWKDGSSPDEDTAFWLNLKPTDLTLPEYVFGGGFVQGEGLSEYIDNFRRRTFDSSSAIFWMFNDCWPCARSWSIVDYYLNRTPSFYHVKRAFRPLRVVLVQENPNEDVQIFGINGTMNLFEGKLIYGVFNSNGQMNINKTCKVKLPPNGSIPIERIPASLAKGTVIPFAVLYASDGREISRNRLLNLRYYEYPLAKPNIRITQQKDVFTFMSDTYVMGVCLDLSGNIPLEDNMFDLYPTIPYQIHMDTIPAVQYTVNDLLQKHDKLEPSIMEPIQIESIFSRTVN